MADIRPRLLYLSVALNLIFALFFLSIIPNRRHSFVLLAVMHKRKHGASFPTGHKESIKLRSSDPQVSNQLITYLVLWRIYSSPSASSVPPFYILQQYST